MSSSAEITPNKIVGYLPKVRRISFRNIAMMAESPFPSKPIECATWLHTPTDGGIDTTPEQAYKRLFEQVSEQIGDAEHVEFVVWPECWLCDAPPDIWYNTGVPEWRAYARFMVMSDV